jgi:hypothetical protein
MKKLTLNKSVISTLTREEAGKVMGGGITDGCQTAIYEGCDPGHSWDNCSNACSGYCDSALCPTITQPYPDGATCGGCATDYAC